MRHKLYFIWGAILLFVCLVSGCSKDLKNPIDPQREHIEKAETSLKKNALITEDFDQSQLNSVSSSLKEKNKGIVSILESPGASSEEVESIGGFWCHAFHCIYDVTEPGGLSTVRFKAKSWTSNWSGNPVFIPKISAEGWGYRNALQVWHDKDTKEDWWDASVMSSPISYKIKWMAGIESRHFFNCGGGNAGWMLLSRTECVVDFKPYTEKADN